jgi:hypothetical protein
MRHARSASSGDWSPVTSGESGAALHRAWPLIADLPNSTSIRRPLTVAGFVDLGRLGRADRHADIALLLANARQTWPDESRAAEADTAFATGYGATLDPDRQRFSLHLDPLTWDQVPH